ncbi:uncharacterized protein LOC122508324 isoform X2 [Leptopilina heterotoma]|nr:uncharacterized protein LOC122508324 isoform X2 [Leptopilina heterotoma]XP_043477539.1 uncharacterized protein LOC122508324 isoform X2 [Leptopilina heterotoma]XP_043477540.1 uncharacterized protein LOC122508324 isoform X2 [Leptopilina heterotoma]
MNIHSRDTLPGPSGNPGTVMKNQTNTEKNLEPSSNNNDDDASNCSSSDFEVDYSEDSVPKFSNSMPFTVSRSNIQFLEFMLAAAKHQYEFRKKMKFEPVKSLTIPVDYFEPGPQKMEISSGCGFYLKTSVINYINLTANDRGSYDWEKIVKNTLVEVFGGNLKHFSASGKRCSRPAIDYRLIKGLHGWVNEVSKDAVTLAVLNIYINKIISNKRKYIVEKKSDSTSVKKKRCKKTEKTQDINSQDEGPEVIERISTLDNIVPIDDCHQDYSLRWFCQSGNEQSVHGQFSETFNFKT